MDHVFKLEKVKAGEFLKAEVTGEEIDAVLNNELPEIFIGYDGNKVIFQRDTYLVVKERNEDETKQVTDMVSKVIELLNTLHQKVSQNAEDKATKELFTCIQNIQSRTVQLRDINSFESIGKDVRTLKSLLTLWQSSNKELVDPLLAKLSVLNLASSYTREIQDMITYTRQMDHMENPED